MFFTRVRPTFSFNHTGVTRWAPTPEGHMSTRLADLNAVDTAYTEALKHEHLPHMAEQLKMPYTNAPIPKLVFQELRKTKYESCPADIQAGIVNFFGLATTLPCEQTNRSAKNAISLDQDHCRIAAERMMLMPYRRGVMHTMNQFNELRHDEYSPAMKHEVETPATKRDRPETVRARFAYASHPVR